MITVGKLKIFSKYKGDGDMWLRSSWPWERNKMSHQDWAIIGEFISDLKLVEQGLAAPAYAESITKRAEENCENTEVVEELRRMSRLV